MNKYTPTGKPDNNPVQAKLYRTILSWDIDVTQDIRLKRNLPQRLKEVEDMIAEIDERIESDTEKGIVPDAFPKFKNEVFYLKYQISELI